MDFCPQVKRLIVAVGVSQIKQLSEIIGYNQTTISNWNGRKKIADEAIVALCLRFGINVQWLVEGRGLMIWGATTGAGLVSEPTPPCTLKERLEAAWEVADEDAKDTALYALEKSARRSPGKGGGVSDLTEKRSA
jgi:hypothetical protein